MKRSEMKPNPEKVRAWLNKSRKPMPRGEKGLARKAPKKKPALPPALRAAVMARSRGRCVVCVHLGVDRPRRAAHVHHLLEQRNFPEYRLVEENCVGVCEPCHDEHERAHRRIPWEALPVVCRDFLGVAALASGAAARAVDRNYPRPGDPRLAAPGNPKEDA